jgi:hypothetical protein
METSKPCRECGEIKPLSEYYTHPTMADGHLNKCIRCVKIRVGIHREKNIERIRKYDIDRSKLPHRIKLREEINDKYPIKQKRAKSLVNSALRSGRLERKPCCVCGNKKVHAHHSDYSKPLSVIWICCPHHGQLHARKQFRQWIEGNPANYTIGKNPKYNTP